jgi:glycosyltransferase involved in cell wall biosynthesis
MKHTLESNPQINLLGWQDDPNDVYARMRASLFIVIPSICHENFPRTLVEAFASGVPVIASRLGAFAELIKEGQTGLLFNAGDSHDFANKLAYAYGHPDEMYRMGQQARAEYERKYTSEQNYRQLLAIYQDASSELVNQTDLNKISKPILKTISNDI